MYHTNAVSESGDTNSSMLAAEQSQRNVAEIVARSAILTIAMVLGTFGNGIILHMILHDKRMQTRGNLFIFSVSFADLGQCVLIMPLTLITIVHETWLFGEGTFCQVQIFVGELLFRASILSIAGLVIERYVTFHRKKIRSHLRLRIQGFKSVRLIWVVSLLLAFPYNLKESSFMHEQIVLKCKTQQSNTSNKFVNALPVIDLLTSICFPLFITLFLFWNISKAEKSVRKRVRPTFLPNEEKLTIVAHAHSAYTTLIIDMFYFLLSFPHIFTQIAGDSRIPSWWRFLAQQLFWTYSSCKPVIYFVRSERFAEHTRRLLHLRSTASLPTCLFLRRTPLKANRAGVTHVISSQELAHSSVGGQDGPCTVDSTPKPYQRVSVKDPRRHLSRFTAKIELKFNDI